MKKLWQENRVLLLLITILIICFIAIVCVALTFFYSKNVSSYGTRLDGIEKHPVSDKFKNKYEDALLENEEVTKVKINVKGRVIYVHIYFADEFSLEDAKSLAIDSLDLFDEKILSYYDINFALKNSEFIMYGAKNTITDHVSWNNNTEIVVEEEETDED